MRKRIIAFTIIAFALLTTPLSQAHGNGTPNPPKNQAPVAVGTIDPVTLGTDSVIVDISDKFSDADGDTLTYTIVSIEDAIATVRIDGSEVTISPQSVFSATITVTAADWCGWSVAQTIAVKMSQTPVVLETIDPVTISNDSVTVDVSGKFSDLDGDTLYFTAEVGDTAIATVSVDGSKVNIKPGAEAGNTTVTVTATDQWGLQVKQNIGVVHEKTTVIENIKNYVFVPVGIAGMTVGGISLFFFNFSINISPNFNINIARKNKIRNRS